MRFDVIVFDFDGTLVQSVDIKAQAFFDVFPGSVEYKKIIGGVLTEDPDGSRTRVIPVMWQRMVEAGLPLPAGQSPQDRIDAYGEEVFRRVAVCPEMAGATDLLHALHNQTAVYVASNTLDAPLKALLQERGWTDLLSGAFGFPHRKADVLLSLLLSHETTPDRIMMVGDGPSDADAARRAGTEFFPVRGADALIELNKALFS